MRPLGPFLPDVRVFVFYSLRSQSKACAKCSPKSVKRIRRLMLREMIVQNAKREAVSTDQDLLQLQL